jgi:hypothetical protein
MELPESPKEIIDEVVSKVEETVLPEIVSKVEELLPEVLVKVEEISDSVESMVKNVDDLANDALNKFVERIPQGSKLVEVVDNALVGTSCSCGLLGWTISVSRSQHSPAKPEVGMNEVPK